jgi:RNA polymerase sigma-70 factor (ECF subfamily)
MSSFPAARFPSLPLSKEKEAAQPIYEPTYKDTSAARPTLEPSDEALIARICADDSDALGLLFSRYARLVWTIARRILQNNEEADDLLQDVFLLVRRRASAFDSSKGSVRSLLVQMCYQRAFSRRRDLARQNFYTSTEVTENTAVAKRTSCAPLYDETIEAHFGKTAIKRAREDLSIEQRETLRLCFYEGHSLEEIAVRLGQSHGNVRHHYYRGLAKLRKHAKGMSIAGGAAQAMSHEEKEREIGEKGACGRQERESKESQDGFM